MKTLPLGIDLSDRIHTMLACYHQWFHTNLKYALGKMGDDSYKETVKNRNKRNDKDEKNIHDDLQ